ncbi:MAG: rod shape-determining protein RodA [Clostridiales bacterium]|nr:rod shape-determining protein RodA [Clostridiales bacterium]
MQKNEQNFRKLMDWWLFSAIVLLCLCGVVFILNATCDPYSETGETGLLGVISRINPYYVRSQLIWLLTGTVLALIAGAFDYKIYRQLAIWIYAFGMFLLALVLFMPAGRGNVKNAIYITDTLSFQPGELVKLCYIVMMARLLSTREGPIQKVRELFPYLLYTALPVGLVILEREVGTALVYLCIFAGMLFLSGTNWKLLVGMGLSAGVCAVPIWFVLGDYQRERILNFLDPSRDVSNTGYHVNNAKMVAGTGELWGKGLFREGAMSQLDYVPEKHTDFIFAVTAEAIGLVGCMILVALFVFVIIRMLKIARTARDSFGSMICIGVASMMAFHIVENICMNIGLLPVTGIPLPFLSYGGSAMWTNLIASAMVLSVSMRRKNTRYENPGN